MSDLNLSIFVEERHGVLRPAEPIRLGVPIARGIAHEPTDLVVCDAGDRVIPHQWQVLARWPDGSCKWLLLDAIVRCGPRTRETLRVRARRDDDCPSERGSIAITEADGDVVIDTGVATFRHAKSHAPLCAEVRVGGHCVAREGKLILGDDRGSVHEAVVDRVFFEERGPVRATLVAEGTVGTGRADARLRFRVRSSYFTGAARARIEVLLHNPRAATHAGGLWDLGDPGSVIFSDLSATFKLRESGTPSLRLGPDDGTPVLVSDTSLTILQASSGGQRWNSRNHVDRNGSVTTPFRGYQVHGSSQGDPIAVGERAEPVLVRVEGGSQAACAIERFWQCFPKALRGDGDKVSFGLFPAEQGSDFELQGGEQKRHVLHLAFGEGAEQLVRCAAYQPLTVWPDPEVVDASRAVAAFSPATQETSREYIDYVTHAIEGPNSFFGKRERIDEYGWRHFGELYADHEAVGHVSPEPLISHYNNQYDFIYGGLVQFLRGGDSRWFELAGDAARHTIDIDIYHTTEDRAAFNGGLFWHTDHYKDAATCTHRTYSRCNAGATAYGGGPSNEHNYTSGLLLYHYLSGDMEARSAVLELAEWVMRMDDGSLTLFSLVSSRPTGAASKTRSEGFHGPGRGAGNSINALLDAYALTRENRYLAKAQELIHRCIHPKDDIAAMRLDDPENRWSYLVFLQVLGKFLDLKSEWGEYDYTYHYARASLLHYARWMLIHERPYKDLLHRVEIPSETWPAHDVRKCHVLHLAAMHADASEAERLREKAVFFFHRCLTDLLSFDTAYLTRPMVLLCVYGFVNSFYMSRQPMVSAPSRVYYFGEPVQFVGQRDNLGHAMRERARVVVGELRRVLRDKLHAVRSRIGTRRTSRRDAT